MADAMAERRDASNRVALFIDVDNVLILAQNSGLPFNLSLIIDRVRSTGNCHVVLGICRLDRQSTEASPRRFQG